MERNEHLNPVQQPVLLVQSPVLLPPTKPPLQFGSPNGMSASPSLVKQGLLVLASPGQFGSAVLTYVSLLCPDIEESSSGASSRGESSKILPGCRLQTHWLRRDVHMSLNAGIIVAEAAGFDAEIEGVIKSSSSDTESMLAEIRSGRKTAFTVARFVKWTDDKEADDEESKERPYMGTESNR
ncbi:MAG: hypothetical protein M1827_007535 [Pycnora praestabilis]|nr:MAG: hypothetical protein M1827_007535 [Pycnora praestabilis]